eukprot:GFKZ01006422.1.p1 GENE.GFKZ01006422.1~~GFKZ01006422.1.p1  ORF type:complete len:220 (-),score=29.98 GFKZ01006422.1:739-1398(-)
MPVAFLPSNPISSPAHRIRPQTSSHPATNMTATPPAKRRVLVPIATGSEEIETSTIVDTLRRAGAEVTVASVESSLSVVMSRSMIFVADTLITTLSPPYDCVALPGGMPGAQRLADSPELANVVADTQKQGGVVAAICAAPAVALAAWGMLDAKTATCYPADAFREKVGKLGQGDVVVDDRLVTATGPGTALKWSLEVVKVLYGGDVAEKLAGEMLAVR